MAGHSGQFPRRLSVNTVIHTTLVGLEPATFRSLVRRATSSATEPTVVPPTCRALALVLARLSCEFSYIARSSVFCAYMWNDALRSLAGVEDLSCVLLFGACIEGELLRDKYVLDCAISPLYKHYRPFAVPSFSLLYA